MDTKMLCNDCRIKIPYDKNRGLTHCGVCGKPFTPDVQDILERGQYGIAKEIRPPQVAMAQDIEHLLQIPQSSLFAEGGTGIGKSFAYLIPALLSEKKRIVIATAKIPLQHQLAEKDIPFLLSRMQIPKTSYVLYKGKSNYACWRLKSLVQKKDQKR